MDIFKIREEVVLQYQNYVKSFLKIRDSRIAQFIEEKIVKERYFLPSALLQLNPSYEKGGSVQELVANGKLHPECKTIFQKQGKIFTLHAHQQEAFQKASDYKNFIVTSGTGSGKSLTYFLPIVNHILNHNPERNSLRAIVVYPMNALVNSQVAEINGLLENSPNRSIRIKKYTGQESRAEKEEIKQNPPHILLTNYMMLELMLTRPDDKEAFIDKISDDFQFLVFDELHTYKGRQGADIGYLIRRLKAKKKTGKLTCIGTSATISSTGTYEERKKVIADFGKTIFGDEFNPENIIQEKLRETIPTQHIYSKEELTNSVKSETGITWAEFSRNPLVKWIEMNFGIKEEDGVFRRQSPITLEEGAKRLAEETGLDIHLCKQKLEELFLKGSSGDILTPEGNIVYPFKLHQFVSQGSALYATLEPIETREFSLNGKVYAKKKNQKDRFFYPIQFCRTCGQEYYSVYLAKDPQTGVRSLKLPLPPPETANRLAVLVGRGLADPAALVPGTLKGAQNLEYTRWFAPDSSAMLPADEVRRIAAASPAAGDVPVVSFCNTGHWAAINWFALSEVAGRPGVKLYPCPCGLICVASLTIKPAPVAGSARCA